MEQNNNQPLSKSRRRHNRNRHVKQDHYESWKRDANEALQEKIDAYKKLGLDHSFLAKHFIK